MFKMSARGEIKRYRGNYDNGPWLNTINDKSIHVHYGLMYCIQIRIGCEGGRQQVACGM